MKPTFNYTLLALSLPIFLFVTSLFLWGSGRSSAVASCFPDAEGKCRAETNMFFLFLPYIDDGNGQSTGLTMTPTAMPTLTVTPTSTATVTSTNTPTPTNTPAPTSTATATPTVISAPQCHVFPIAMHAYARSATDPNDFFDAESDYPDADQFSYPDSPPSYYDFLYDHSPNLPFWEAEEGTVFLVKRGHGFGNFVWLAWNIYGDNDVARLSRSLDWPGNSTNYRDTTAGSWSAELQALYGPDPVVGYINPYNYIDATLSVGDPVLTYSGNAYHADMIDILSEHVDRKRVLPMLLWENDFSGGSFTYAEVSNLVVWGRIIGYRLEPGNTDAWLLIETVVVDDDCLDY